MMADDIANILIRLGADTSEGDKKFDEFRKGLAEFGRIKETAEARVEVKGSDKLIEAVAALNKWDHTRVTASAEIKVDETPLDAALRKVRELGEQRPKVPADVVPGGTPGHGVDLIPPDQAEKLTKLGRALDALDSRFRAFFDKGNDGFQKLRDKSSLLDTAVDLLGHGFEDAVLKFGPALTKATEGLAKGLDAIGGQSGVIGGPTSALADVFKNLATEGPKGLAAIIPVAGLAAAAINALITTAIALGASLAAAAGGVAALGAAFVAALGPAVLVLVGVFNQLREVIAAVSAGRQQNASQVDALKKATLQQQAAQIQLTKATTSGNTAAVNAIQQQKDAVLALANAYLGLQSAKLGITDAALALEQANLALKSFKANLPAGLSVGGLIKKAQDISVTGGGPQNATPAGGQGGAAAAELQFDQLQQQKAHALLGVQQAAQGVANATNTYAKAQLAVTGGIGGTTRATNAATAAAQRLALANIAVQRAQLAIDKAKGTDQIQSLTKAGKDLVPVFTKVADTVLKTFQPATDAVLRAIGKAAKVLIPVIQELAPPFKELGRIMGDALITIVRAFSTPAFINLFKGFITDSALLIKVITPAFISFLTILFEIAKDAMPALLTLFRLLGGVFADVAKHPSSIARAVNIAIAAFFAWGKLIGSVVVVLGRLIGIAAPLGTGLVQQITKLVQKFGEFLNTKKGRDEVTKWLKDGIATFKRIVEIVVALLVALKPVFTTLSHIGDTIYRLAPLIRILGEVINVIFTGILAPINLFLDAINLLINGVGKLIDLLGKVKLPNVASGLLNLVPGGAALGGLFHAEGGIATRATAGVFGEAGPEGIIPLTDAVFAKLGAAIAPNIGRSLHLVGGKGKTVNQTNHIEVKAPGGHAPDTNHFMAEIENRLDALGAVA